MDNNALKEQSGKGNKHARRVYFLTSPRTASNLFVKILNIYEQPQAAANSYHGGYFFMPAFKARDEMNSWHIPVTDLPDDQNKSIHEAVQSAADHLRDLTENAGKEGKIMFVKEHINLLESPNVMNELIHGTPANSMQPPWTIHIDEATDLHTPQNPTFLPDNWLHTFEPTFLIRHPALQIPSLWRAHRDITDTESRDTPSRRASAKALYSLKPVRQLYDFYNTYYRDNDPTSPYPLIIESSDFINNPVAFMRHFCELTGFDFSKCKFEWDAASKEDLVKLRSDTDRRFLSTLNASTGIVKSKASLNVNIDVEAKTWREEFGEEQGKYIEFLVRACMPDYLYLKERRWLPVGMEDTALMSEEEVQSRAHIEGRNGTSIGA